jgi:DNA-binding NarL/FixJ family response regulator
MEPIELLIADDHPTFRRGLRALLRNEQSVAIVGEVETGDDAVAFAERLQPQIVLMDVQMPGCNGIEATRRILAQSPHIRILMLTMFDDDDMVFAAMQAGARGYLLKGADKGEILRALRAVASGEAIFGPAIAVRMMRFFAPRPAQLTRPFPELTDRELEILGLLAQGKSNNSIAERLVVSLKTVRNHVSNILAKLEAADRAEAIDRARDAGLGRS